MEEKESDYFQFIALYPAHCTIIYFYFKPVTIFFCYRHFRSCVQYCKLFAIYIGRANHRSRSCHYYGCVPVFQATLLPKRKHIGKYNDYNEYYTGIKSYFFIVISFVKKNNTKQPINRRNETTPIFAQLFELNRFCTPLNQMLRKNVSATGILSSILVII